MDDVERIRWRKEIEALARENVRLSFEAQDLNGALNEILNALKTKDQGFIDSATERAESVLERIRRGKP